MKFAFSTAPQPTWQAQIASQLARVKAAKAAMRRGRRTPEDDAAVAAGFEAMVEMLFGEQRQVPHAATEIEVDGLRFTFSREGLVLHQECAKCDGEVAYYIDGPGDLAVALDGQIVSCGNCAPAPTQIYRVPAHAGLLKSVA